MSKPDPSITADILTKLPARKADAPKGAGQSGHKDHASRTPVPPAPKVTTRTAEKSGALQGHTRSSNRGK
jgi:hypothetical protein